jgi:hypothetical protein
MLTSRLSHCTGCVAEKSAAPEIVTRRRSRAVMAMRARRALQNFQLPFGRMWSTPWRTSTSTDWRASSSPSTRTCSALPCVNCTIAAPEISTLSKLPVWARAAPGSHAHPASTSARSATQRLITNRPSVAGRLRGSR